MNEMNVFRIEDNRTSPPTVKEYEVVDSAAREDISEIKADFLQLDDGKIAITKDVVWQNGYIATNGVIRNSSLSAFALVSLNDGETVKIGTANSNITIIGSTDAESLAVGDTVSVIATTTSSDTFEEYSYQATGDMNIVLCVLKSNYTCEFYKQSNFIKQIDDKFSDVFAITRKEVGSETASAKAGAFIGVAATTINVNLSADEEMSFCVKDPSNAITKYYLYLNDTSDYARHLTNKEYFITLSQDTTRVAIYAEPSFVVGDGIIECVVNKITRNANSVEAKAVDAFETSQEHAKYIPHGITDGYIYGSVVENGSFVSNGTLTTGVENKIRTTLIPFKTGDKIVINAGAFMYGCGMWEGEPSSSTVKRNDQSWISNGETITTDYDGYIVIVFKKSDNSNIVPADFDGSILLYNTLAYRNSVSTNSGYLVPDYFLADNYLLNKANRINELGQNADDVFFFITDVHWELNAKHSPDIIEYLSKKCNVPRLFDGGDVADRIIQSAVDKYRNAFSRSIYRTVGNHDRFPPITGKNLYYAFDILNNEQVGNAFDHYYYVDNAQQKIRYVILNAFYHEGNETGTGWSSYDEEQKNWFSQTALNLPSSDWDVIVFTHFLKTTSYVTGGADIGNAIDSFNEQPEHTGKILAVFQGHTHWDGVYHTAGGVPVITITCDKWDLSNETSTIPAEGIAWREKNTIKEQAFDVAILNREARKFTCVRIGAPAQNNIDKYRTDSGFTWIGTLEEREITY